MKKGAPGRKRNDADSHHLKDEDERSLTLASAMGL